MDDLGKEANTRSKIGKNIYIFFRKKKSKILSKKKGK